MLRFERTRALPRPARQEGVGGGLVLVGVGGVTGFGRGKEWFAAGVGGCDSGWFGLISWDGCKVLGGHSLKR